MGTRLITPLCFAAGVLIGSFIGGAGTRRWST